MSPRPYAPRAPSSTGARTRRQWRDLEKAIIADTKLPVARVPRSWARWLVEEAARRTQEAGRNPPREFAEVRHTMEAPREPQPHPALAALSDEAIARALEV